MIDKVVSGARTVAAVITAAALAFLIGFSVWQNRQLREARAERDSYIRNTETLLGEVETFRAKNGQLVSRVQSLELKESEFERMMAEDARTIKALRRRNEELDRLVKLGTQTEVRFETVVRDSIVYRGYEGAEAIKKIEWSDLPWAAFKAEIGEYDRKVKASMMFHDEVDVIVMLEYKRFLWWNTRVKGASVDVISHSPYVGSIDVSSVSIRNK